MPALIRKIHLAKCLNDDNWLDIRKDLDKNPIHEISGSSSQEDILLMLSKNGVERDEVEIWGSGEPRREFLWSEDMADACVFLLKNRNFEDTLFTEEKEIRNTHINIGTGVDISIRDLADLIKACIGFEGNFNFNVSKPNGVMQKLTDVSKLHQLGWKHTVSIQEGVEKIYCCYLAS
jgi:GDP-L-fucose synthase